MEEWLVRLEEYTKSVWMLTMISKDPSSLTPVQRDRVNRVKERMHDLREKIQTIVSFIEKEEQAGEQIQRIIKTLQENEEITLLRKGKEETTQKPLLHRPSSLPQMRLITEKEYQEEIPFYMKSGKLTHTRLNQIVEDMNRMLQEKERMQKSKRKDEMGKKMVWEMKSSEMGEVKGKGYVTNVDMKNMWKEGVVKRAEWVENPLVMKQISQILRHLGRMREVRGGGYVRYVFL